MTTVYAETPALWTRLVLPRLVEVPGPLPTPCHVWTRGTTSNGYGSVGAGKRGKNVATHRLALMVAGVDVPDTADHLCCNKRCCNPIHMEPVSRAENSRRRWVRQRATT